MNEEPDPRFQRGFEAYREGRYFEAHEHWEDMWRAQPDLAKKRLLQGLIQVAAAMHKLLVMHDASSAQRLLGRAAEKLEEPPVETYGLDLVHLRAEVHRTRDAIASIEGRGTLERENPSDMHNDTTLIPQLRSRTHPS